MVIGWVLSTLGSSSQAPQSHSPSHVRQTGNGEQQMQIVVVGTGRMGAGIGLGFAQHGAAVTYLTRDSSRARDAVARVAAEFVAIGAVDRQRGEALDFCTEIDDLPSSQLIIESVPEDLALKVPLLAELSRAQPDALLCSNTSSLSITAIAADTARPDRVAGMHFWYPAPLMPLVELVPGSETTDDTLDRGARILAEHGKVPIRLQRDLPGFVWNRLVVAVLREAMSLVAQGVVTAREIDLVVEQGLARRWSLTGPFASAVLGGVSTFETVGRNLLPQLSSATDLEGLAGMLSDYVADTDGLNTWRNQQLSARGEPSSWG
jgi:3-hydroxybutyryl-CoA dehydrogenase